MAKRTLGSHGRDQNGGAARGGLGDGVGTSDGGSGVDIYRVGGVAGAAAAGMGSRDEEARRPAVRRRPPTATAAATYSWGTEARKGGVREKFVATVDAADMVKVRCLPS